MSQLTIALFLWGVPAIAAGVIALMGYHGRRPFPGLALVTFFALLLVPLGLLDGNEWLAPHARRLPTSTWLVLAVPAGLGAMIVQWVHTAWFSSTRRRPSGF